MWRRKRGWILLICLSIEGVPETSEGHPVLANRKAGLSSRKQQLKQSWRRYKKWKLLPLLFELAFMNCQFRWEISLLGNGWSNLNDFRPPWISNSDQMLKMCKKVLPAQPILVTFGLCLCFGSLWGKFFPWGGKLLKLAGIDQQY